APRSPAKKERTTPPVFLVAPRLPPYVLPEAGAPAFASPQPRHSVHVRFVRPRADSTAQCRRPVRGGRRLGRLRAGIHPAHSRRVALARPRSRPADGPLCLRAGASSRRPLSPAAELRRSLAYGLPHLAVRRRTAASARPLSPSVRTR